MTYKDKIMEIGRANGGYIIGRDLDGKGISSSILSRMEKDGSIEKTSRGVYKLVGYPYDDFYDFNNTYKAAAFSRRTALYLNNLSNKQLDDLFDVNFPQGYNASNVKGASVRYPGKKMYDLGKTKVETPCGHMVDSYDVERCLCDIFYYDACDIEEQKFAFREASKRKLDYDKLYYYAEKMGVLREIRAIFEAAI